MISDRGDVAWILVSSLRYFLHRNAVEINFIMDAEKNWSEDFYFENNRSVEYATKAIVSVP